MRNSRVVVLIGLGVAAFVGATWFRATYGLGASKHTEADVEEDVVNYKPGTFTRDLEEIENILTAASEMSASAPAIANHEAISAPQAGNAVDEEWKSFPRTNLHFRRLLLSRTRPIEAKVLFRNRRLNPPDTYIPKESRAVLEEVVSRYKTFLASLQKKKEDLISKELNIAVETGRAQPGNIEDYLYSHRRLKMSEEKREFWDARIAKAGQDPNKRLIIPLSKPGEKNPTYFRYTDNKIYPLKLSQMPMASEVERARRFVAIEFANAIVSFFAANRLVSAEQGHKCLEEVDSFINR